MIQAFPPDATEKSLADRGRDPNPELEQLPANARGTPELIVLGHLLNQGNRLGGQLGTTISGPRFEFPKEAKALAMPAQKRLRLKDREDIFPVMEPNSQEEEPEAIWWSEPEVASRGAGG